MKFLALIFLLATPAFGWQAVPHEEGTAQRIDGEKISGAAETGDNVYILIEPKQVLPQLEPGPEIAYRKLFSIMATAIFAGRCAKLKSPSMARLCAKPTRLRARCTIGIFSIRAF